MAHFTSDGLDLAYDEFGPADARKAIVLVHGFSANRYENWKRMGWYDAIASKGLRGFALDNRGHGESAKPHDPALYDREAMARDVFALLDHAGVERAHLLGFSMGSHIALTAALIDSGRIDHLVVAGVGARGPEFASASRRSGETRRDAGIWELAEEAEEEEGGRGRDGGCNRCFIAAAAAATAAGFLAVSCGGAPPPPSSSSSSLPSSATTTLASASSFFILFVEFLETSGERSGVPTASVFSLFFPLQK